MFSHVAYSLKRSTVCCWQVANAQVARRTQVSIARVRVDGFRNVQEVLAEASSVSFDYSRPFRLITLGQPGLVSGLHVAAALRQGSVAPAFSFASTQTMMKLGLATQEEFEFERNRVGNKNEDRRKIYCMSFPPSTVWRSQEERQIATKLVVPINRMQINSFAKAITARAATVLEGQAVALETPLIGEEKLTRLRIARMAEALAMAHHWEESPVDPNKPTRSFKCIADMERQHDSDGWVLRIEVLPEGGPKPWPWRPAAADKDDF